MAINKSQIVTADRPIDRAMIGKLRAFAEAHIPVSARNATETAIANIENRIRVREQRIPAIVAWLEKKGG